ncbi:MAG: phosphoribosyl-ATP diphosphatase [Maricaulaceae bacterium]
MVDLGEALTSLFETIEARKTADPHSSYTAKLLAAGPAKCAKKLGEEGVETALAGVSGDRDELIHESADLLYHLSVLWAACDVRPSEVAEILAQREGVSGLVEKASRAD